MKTNLGLAYIAFSMLMLASVHTARAQSGTWQTAAPMPTASYGLGAEFVNGKLYAISGFATDRVAAYDPVAGTWAIKASIPGDPGDFALRQFFGHAVIGNKIYVVGGDTGGSGFLATVLVYDTTADTWAHVAPMPGGARYALKAGAINGKLYAVGGTNGSYLSLNECYDPVSDTWTTVAPLPSPRAGGASAVINGRLYLAGGSDAGGPLQTLSIYDPVADSWSSGASMPIPQDSEAAVVDGVMFIPGGGPAPENMVSVYNPASNSWGSETTMRTGRHALGVAGDPVNRMVYAVGGYNGSLLSTLEVLTPASISPSPTPTSTPKPGQPLNVSTRLQVLTGDNVLIGGFIVTGTAAKKVIIRAIGPSLRDGGVANALADTVLELHSGAATLITNDNWRDDPDQAAQIQATGIPPQNDLESAIVATLAPGAYTAVVSGKNGTAGVGLVEIYDLDQTADSKLGNISTRGFVDVGDNVMIGGFIIGPDDAQAARVLIRAIGPSLPVAGAMQDPMLELHDANGTTIASNDNWKDTQQADTELTGIPPVNDLESAIVQTLVPGAYTAIVSGKNNTTGVGLVEVYNLDFRITSVSNSALTPFEKLSLVGTGFNPIAAISVRFFNANGFSMKVPVANATSRSLEVIVPPYFDPVTQIFASGAVSLEVLQTIGTATITSNTVSGLTIADMPALTMPPGTVTANWAGFLELYLSGVEANLAAAQNFSGGQVNTVDLQASIETVRTNFGQLKGLIRASISDPSQTPTIGVLSGVPITLNQTMLRQSDQLVTAMFQQLEAVLQMAQTQSETTAHSTSTTFPDKFATVNGVTTTTSCPLSYIEVIDALVYTPNSESVVNARYANYLQRCADHYRDVVVPFWKSYSQLFTAIALIPPATIYALPVAGVAGWMAVGAQGMAARLDFVAAAVNADDPIALQRAQAAWAGTILGVTCGVFSDVLEKLGHTASIIFDTADTLTGVCEIKVPSFEGQAVAFIASHTYTLSITTNGLGSGIVIPDPLGPTYPPGTLVTLTAVPNSGSSFSGWSGAAGGTGQALVVMDADKSVTATFDLSTPTPTPAPEPLTGTWIGTWEWSGPGSNGCQFTDGGSFSMTLTQTGTSFSGSTSGAGIQFRDDATCALTSTDSGTGTASGTISGTILNLSFDLSNGGGSLSFNGTATLNNNTLTASFVRSTGGSGSFTVTRQ